MSAALVVLWLSAATASNQDSALAEAKAKALALSAQKAYDVGDFTAANVAYAEAYRLIALPGFLLNMGQCERKLGHLDRALFLFHRYLDLAPEGKSAPLARELINETEKQLPRAPSEATSKTYPVLTPWVVAAPLSMLAPPQPPPSRARRVVTSPWFWTGVLATVGGGVALGFALHHSSAAGSPTLGVVDTR